MKNSWPKEKLTLVNAAGIHHGLRLLQVFVHLAGDLSVGRKHMLPYASDVIYNPVFLYNEAWFGL